MGRGRRGGDEGRDGFGWEGDMKEGNGQGAGHNSVAAAVARGMRRSVESVLTCGLSDRIGCRCQHRKSPIGK